MAAWLDDGFAPMSVLFWDGVTVALEFRAQAYAYISLRAKMALGHENKHFVQRRSA